MAVDSQAVDFSEVQKQEREQIKARREALDIACDEDKEIKDAPRFPTLGLALSGGGIRSATFNLGIIQGLTRLGLLKHIDYLSTVSGGGYIGTWLHGVIQRYGRGDPRKVENLFNRPDVEPHQESDKDPIYFLRNYSSYLAPDVGLFSADFWVILVIWFRNTILNQLMLVPFLAAVTLVITLMGVLRAHVSSGAAPANQIGTKGAWAIVGIVLCTLAAVLITARGASEVGVRRRSLFDGNWAAIASTLFLHAAAFGLASMSSTLAPLSFKVCFLFIFFLIFALQLLMQWVGGFTSCFRKLHPGHESWAVPLLFFLPAVAAAATSGLVYGGIKLIASWEHTDGGSWHVVAWGPPLILMLWLIGAGVHIGFMGVDYPDDRREWMARIGAFVNIAVVSWLMLFVLCIFGPYWLSSQSVNHGKTLAAAIGGWIVTTLSGVFAGKSDKTSGTGEQAKWNPMELVGLFAPVVFVVGLTMLISFGVHAAVRALTVTEPKKAASTSPTSSNPSDQKIDLKVQLDRTVTATLAKPVNQTPSWLEWMKPIANDYWAVLESASEFPAKQRVKWFEPLQWVVIMIGGCIVVVVFVGWRVNINEFSMHHFYKNRLVRCYLGASHPGRLPSRLTGFDSEDDIDLEHLLAQRDRSGGEDIPPYFGPYPIVNGAVNIDRGDDMAKNERKAESFVFTPLYCGFTPPRTPEGGPSAKIEPYAYRTTFNYMYPKKGPRIGTCMAVSGAAANPNAGYHTSPMIAFLLTMFDVRLGWWVGNPRRRAKSSLPGPRFAPWPLVSELCAQTDARASYLNISDGGHFENLGLYELIRRGCDFIIVGDGEQDNDLNFESLGGAIRKCRADFGVDIAIDIRRIQKKDGFSRTHCVVGTIHYPFPKKEGKLLYLKASLTGDEPEDVTQYHSVHQDFPHQTTAHQFFTESQFESYRKLGVHVLASAFENVSWKEVNLQNIFQSLYQQWYPPSEAADKAGSRNNEAYSALVRRIGEDPDLSRLLSQVVCGYQGGIWTGVAGTSSESGERKTFLVCLELIQLMENVWSDLHFFDSADRESPANAGWIEIFEHWANAEDILQSWKIAQKNFNPRFRQFFELMAEQGKKKD